MRNDIRTQIAATTVVRRTALSAGVTAVEKPCLKGKATMERDYIVLRIPKSVLFDDLTETKSALYAKVEFPALNLFVIAKDVPTGRRYKIPVKLPMIGTLLGLGWKDHELLVDGADDIAHGNLPLAELEVAAAA